jgi:hypothetical protein
MVSKVVSERLYVFPISCMHAASEPTLRPGSHMVKKLQPLYSPNIHCHVKKIPIPGLILAS